MVGAEGKILTYSIPHCLEMAISDTNKGEINFLLTFSRLFGLFNEPFLESHLT